MSGFDINSIPRREDLAELPGELLKVIQKGARPQTSLPHLLLEDVPFREDVHELLYTNEPSYADLWDGRAATGDASADSFKLIRRIRRLLPFTQKKTKSHLPKMTPNDYKAHLKEYYRHIGSSKHPESWFDREIQQFSAEYGITAAEEEEEETAGKLKPMGSRGAKRPGMRGKKPELLSLQDLKGRPDLLVPPEALIPNFVWSGNTTLLVGRDKCGKSTLARSLISSYSQSGGPVLWVRVEENLTHLLNCFELTGANLENIFVFDVRSIDFEDIQEHTREVQPKIIVLDTLTTWMSEHGVKDENAAAQVIPVLTQFIDLAQDTGPGILLLHHKQKEGKEYRGSTAIGASVDMIVTMDGKDSNERTFKPLGRFDLSPFSMEYDGVEYSYIGDPNQDDVDERVLRYIMNHPGQGKNEIRTALRGDHNRLDKALQNLKDQGRIVNQGSKSKFEFVAVPASTPQQPISTLQHTAQHTEEDLEDEEPEEVN